MIGIVKRLITTILLFTLLSVPAAAADQPERAEVTKVIDGDTIEIKGGERVRYIGIDTPELNIGKRGAKPECYAREATLRNHELVYGKTVTLEKDVRDRDKYGRLLRYVYVDDVRINDLLIREGYAEKFLFPDDKKYAEEIKAAAVEAKESGSGMWVECNDSEKIREAENRWEQFIERLRKFRNLVAELFNKNRIRCAAGDCS